MVLLFTGTAHPKPSHSARNHPADFNRAEIATTDLGKPRRGSLNGTPILVEHEDDPVGRIMTSWEGPGGNFRVMGRINDRAAEEAVRSGQMRGLSLGTGIVQSRQAASAGSMDSMHRSVHEVSICEVPKRAGCYIDEVDGSRVSTIHCASKKDNKRPRGTGVQKPHMNIRLERVR